MNFVGFFVTHLKMVDTGNNFQLGIIIFIVISLFTLCFTNEDNKKENKEPKKEGWKKKDIRDYSDADLERLLDQWEVGQLSPL